MCIMSLGNNLILYFTGFEEPNSVALFEGEMKKIQFICTQKRQKFRNMEW